MTAAGDDGIGTPTSARSGYGAGLFDHRRRLEVQRLRALEAYNDPATQSVILARGVQPGWRCLELGGGAGSIARWLAAHSAPGEVVVTDLDTRLLPRGIPNLTVLRHDVVHDDFPAASFDLVHARALLEHLPKPTDVLAKMVRWTAPGGWVCVDDLISIRPPGGPRDAHQRCWNALVTLAEGTMRIDQHWAATLPRLFAAQGLTDIGVHCTPGLVEGAATPPSSSGSRSNSSERPWSNGASSPTVTSPKAVTCWRTRTTATWSPSPSPPGADAPVRRTGLDSPGRTPADPSGGHTKLSPSRTLTSASAGMSCRSGRGPAWSGRLLKPPSSC